MNENVEKIAESLIADLPETEREQAREILRSCQFQDASDPILGLMRLLQLREKSLGDKERPLAASVARLEEELNNRVCEVKHYKLTLFVGSVVVALAIGVLAGLAIGKNLNKSNGNSTGQPDSVLADLQRQGLTVTVYDNPKEPTQIGLGLHGEFVRTEQLPNKDVLIIFRKRQ